MKINKILKYMIQLILSNNWRGLIDLLKDIWNLDSYIYSDIK